MCIKKNVLSLLSQFFLIVLWNSMVFPVVAQDLNDLYQAEVPLTLSTSTEALDQNKATGQSKASGQDEQSGRRTSSGIEPMEAQALQEALKTVLLRLYVAPKILENPRIQKAIAAPDPYVKQFSYHEGPLPHDRSIKVQFNEHALGRLFQEVGMNPIIGSRPLILLWLCIEPALQTAGSAALSVPGTLGSQESLEVGGLAAGSSARFLNTEADMAILNQVAVTFKQYGMPLVLPLWDLQDQHGLSIADFQTADLLKIRVASERYHPDVIMLATIKQHAQTSFLEWRLIQAAPKQMADEPSDQQSETPLRWQKSGPLLESLWAQSLEPIALFWSKHQPPVDPNAAAPSQSMRYLSLHIRGRLAAEDHARILQYLGKIPAIVRISMQQIGPEGMELRITTRVSQQTLMYAITQSDILLPDPEAKPSLGALFYQYQAG